MSLIRKSDVKNHLSTRSGSTSLPASQLVPPDAAPDPASKGTGTKVDKTAISISPDPLITLEALPNRQGGDYVDIPASAGNSGSPS